jgi:diadenosine tetraphosphate (Ap4A) HIT family hydrolase
MSAAADCVFCRIISGEIPGTFVHEDEVAVAFMDVAPANTGHVLVVPRRHAALVPDLDEEWAAALLRVARLVDAALRGSTLSCDGVNLVLSDGEPAGQEVPHAHLHVVPRLAGDAVRFSFGAPQQVARADLDAAAAAIRKAWPA